MANLGTQHHNSRRKGKSNSTYNMDKDFDMDAQPKNVTPGKGNSSLQLSLAHSSHHSQQSLESIAA